MFSFHELLDSSPTFCEKHLLDVSRRASDRAATPADRAKVRTTGFLESSRIDFFRQLVCGREYEIVITEKRTDGDSEVGYIATTVLREVCESILPTWYLTLRNTSRVTSQGHAVSLLLGSVPPHGRADLGRLLPRVR